MSIDENGNILDGHERKSVCDELGIPCEKTVHPGMTEEEKFDFAIRVNVNRRHLTQEQMTDVIIKFHKEHPDLGNRAVADAVGVDDHTVKNAIAKVTENNNGDTGDECPGAEIPHLDTVKGMDGKNYPADAEKAEQQQVRPEDQIKCPKCVSINVTTTLQGWNFKTGMLGSGQTVNRRGNCGYKWKPKKNR